MVKNILFYVHFEERHPWLAKMLEEGPSLKSRSTTDTRHFIRSPESLR